MLLSLRLPANNDRGPLYADQALAGIHQGNLRREPLTLIYGARDGTAGLFVRLPSPLQALATGQLLAHYPDLVVEPIADNALAAPVGTIPFRRQLDLAPYLFPIRRYPQFTDELNRTLADPASAILAAVVAAADDPLRPVVELSIVPAPPKTLRRAKRVLRRLQQPFFAAHPRLAGWYAADALSPSRLSRFVAFLIGRLAGRASEPMTHDPTHVTAAKAHDREDDKQAAADKLGRHCFACVLTLTVYARPEDAQRANERLDRLVGAFGQFSLPRLASFRVSSRKRPPLFLLSSEEVASLWHFPVTAAASPSVATLPARELEPPVTLPTVRTHADLAILGETDFRQRREVFGLLPQDKLRHLALLGKTGQGKTTLMENLILADIRAGRGLIFVDPHGDAYELLTRHIPRRRTNEVVLFDPSDTGHSLAFNLLDCPDPARRPLVASGVVSAFKKVFADSWGPRLQYLLTNSVLTLLHRPGSTLVSIVRLLSDSRYRQVVVDHTADPPLRAFWAEFATLPPRQRTEWTSPVLNKVGGLVTNPLLRNVVGQPRSTLDLRQAMDRQRIVLCNFSKGKLGEDAAILLGSLFVTAVQLAALSRADLTEQERHPFGLYLDEFHSFVTSAFATLFSEGRKFGVSLIVATQFLEQLDDLTLAALIGNVGSFVTFQVSQRDAEAVAEILGPPVTPDDLRRLPQYQAVVRLLIDGYPSPAFSMRTLSLTEPPQDAQQPVVLRRAARHRYMQPQARIERELATAFAD